jgi:hypothetical protein
MAMVDSVIAEHSALSGSYSDPIVLVSELDWGVLNAAKIAKAIYDGTAVGRDEVDCDALAAFAQSMILLLGRLGPLIDTLEEYVETAEASVPGRHP